MPPPRWQATILPVTMPAGSAWRSSRRCRRRRPRRGRPARGRDAGGDRRARRASAVAPSPPVRVSVDWNARVCVDAATVMTHGERWSVVPAPGPRVAGRGGDGDAGVVGVEERQLDRSVNGLAPPLIEKLMTSTPSRIACCDGGGGVGREAALGAADLVLDDPGAGGDAADRAAVDAEDRRAGDVAAGRGAVGVRAVAVAVTRRVRGRPRRRSSALYVSRNGCAADELVVALEHVGRRRQRVVAEVARARRAVGLGGGVPRSPVVGERRVLGPDAGVEVGEDDALAGVGWPPARGSRSSARR